MRITGHSKLVMLAVGLLVAHLSAADELRTRGSPDRYGRGRGDPVHDLTEVPSAAQGSISTTIGRDDGSYHARATTAGLALVNARHGLDARFDARGVELLVGDGGLGLCLTASGYGEGLHPVAPAQPRARANRVEYDHGAVSEWYVNGPLGIEQGFTVAAPPVRSGPGLLTLAVSLSGTLAASLAAGGDVLTFATPSGAPRLSYRGLSAFDATGRELPARLELREGALLFRVDDHGARYPLTIDPFFEQAKLTASDKASISGFGYSVAISGDTIVVGVPSADGGRGSAYIFVRPASGWAGPLNEQAKLVASDRNAGDSFGWSVGVSGETIVVGAFRDSDFISSRGSAYVFVRPASGWGGLLTEQAKLRASDARVGDFFGDSVAISGDTIVAGAVLDDVGVNANQGSAYVFVKPASGWTGFLFEQAKLTASDGAFEDWFGYWVGASGDTVVVGAVHGDVGANGNQGAAYVFVRPPSGWSGALDEQAKLTASDGAAIDEFGSAVAISDMTVVVGAHNAGSGPGQSQGAAYVFVQPASGWAGALSEQAKLAAADAAPGDAFGSSVAISGDTIVVGAPGDNTGPPGPFNADQGSAYVFIRPTSGWGGVLTQDAKLIASDRGFGDTFGNSLGVSGRTVVSGTPGSSFGHGAAYVFGEEPVPSITLSPSFDSGFTGPFTITATVTAGGQPQPARSVTFTVTGTHTLSGGCTTDSNGQCSFTYTGVVGGADTIVGCAGQICATARKFWTERQADLSATKTCSPAEVFVEDTVTCTVTVTNLGPHTATDVMMTDTVTGAGAVLSAIPSQGGCSSTASSASCNLGSLAAGTWATVTVAIHATDVGLIADSAVASSNAVDFDPTNNTTSTVEVLVLRPPLDHFALYRTRDADRSDHEAPERRVRVTLRDEFGETPALVRATTLLGNPAGKTHDGIVTAVLQPEAHLVGMDTNVDVHGRPRHRVLVTSQFGAQMVNIRKPDLLLVPSSKSPAPDPPGPVPRFLDHFLCYAASAEDDGDERTPVTRVTLADEFQTVEVEVGTARILCNPVEKIHDGVVTPIGSPDEHLTCYDIRSVERRSGPRRSVTTLNQFGLEALDVSKAEMLCVPSRTEVLTTVPDDDDGSHDHR